MRTGAGWSEARRAGNQFYIGDVEDRSSHCDFPLSRSEVWFYIKSGVTRHTCQYLSGWPKVIAFLLWKSQGLRTIVSGQSDQILRRGKSQLQLHMSDIAQRSFELAHYLTRRSAVGHPRLDCDWITVIC
jgi:hypothetical protein